MVVLALVNTESSDGGYFIASSPTSMTWNGIPQDLADVMQDVYKKGEEVMQVSIGLDGDWFLRTDGRHAAKELHESPGLVSNVSSFLTLAESGGLDLSQYEIQFFTFVPNTAGYVTVLHKTDDTLSRCAWGNVPPELDAMLERESSHGVHHVTVGINGSYVIIMNSGIVWWDKVPQGLGMLLQQAKDAGRRVQNVSLSLIADSWYFVEFADGGVEYSLPEAWHPTITKHAAIRPPVRLSMSTSYNSTVNSPPPMYTQNTYNPQMYGNGADPKPYQNPTVVAQLAPVNTVTTVSQEAAPKKESNMKAKIEVIAEVLKVSVAVINFANNGGINIGGNGIF